MKKLLIPIVIFTAACMAKADDTAKAGNTDVFVSHTLAITEIWTEVRHVELPPVDWRAQAIDTLKKTREAVAQLEASTPESQRSDRWREQDLEINCLMQSVGRYLDNPEFYKMDDDGKITEFLKSYGYENVTSIEIDKVRAVMLQRGIQHVWDLVQPSSHWTYVSPLQTDQRPSPDQNSVRAEVGH